MKKTKQFNFDRAKVAFDRNKEEDDELDLFKGEIITIIAKKDENVWIGLKENNQKGFLPSAFVQILNKDNSKETKEFEKE